MVNKKKEDSTYKYRSSNIFEQRNKKKGNLQPEKLIGLPCFIPKNQSNEKSTFKKVQNSRNDFLKSTQVPFPKNFGRYSIRKKIGFGGMGEVYLVHDPTLDRQVALKILKQNLDYMRKNSYKQSFVKEMQTAAKLNHPHIIRIYDAGIHDEQLFFTMEYIEGKTLKKIIEEDNMAKDEMLLIFSKILKAIDYAHGQKIIHRDLKPNNIIIDVNNEPRILDFGLAKILQKRKDLSTNSTKQIVGTIPYISPEQIKEKKISLSTDIYSLGIILYEILTGDLPFSGNAINIIYQITTEIPQKPSEINKSILPQLESICLRSISVEKDKRPTAKEFAQEIDQYLNPVDNSKVTSTIFQQYSKYSKYLFATVATILLVTFFYFLKIFTINSTAKNISAKNDIEATKTVTKKKEKEPLKFQIIQNKDLDSYKIGVNVETERYLYFFHNKAGKLKEYCFRNFQNPFKNGIYKIPDDNSKYIFQKSPKKRDFFIIYSKNFLQDPQKIIKTYIDSSGKKMYKNIKIKNFALKTAKRKIPLKITFYQTKKIPPRWLKVSDTLISNWIFQIRLNVMQKTYLYVFQKCSSGNIYPVFPKSQEGVKALSNLLEIITNDCYYIPFKGSGLILDNKIGSEIFYFLYTNSKIKQARKVFNNYLALSKEKKSKSDFPIIVKKFNHK